MKTTWKRNTERWLGWVSISCVVIAWAVVTGARLVPSLYLPSLGDFADAYELFSDTLLTHMGATFLRLLLGFAFGCSGGIVLGLLMSASRALSRFFSPLVDAFRPVPIIALVPLFILWFGIGEAGKVLLIAFGCFVILIVQTLEAVKAVPPIFVNAARTLGASRVQVFRTVIGPAIVPQLIAGVRVAAAASFGLVVAAEFLGAQSGLGYMIIMGRRFLRTNVILLSVVVLSLGSLALDYGIQLIGRRLTQWQEKTSIGR